MPVKTQAQKAADLFAAVSNPVRTAHLLSVAAGNATVAAVAADTGNTEKWSANQLLVLAKAGILANSAAEGEEPSYSLSLAGDSLIAAIDELE